jgi:transposase
MSRRRQKPPRRIQIPIQELNAIVERTRSEALPEAEHATLKAAVETLARLTAELESTQTTLARVQRILFGSPTETTAAVLGEEKTAESPPADAPTSPGQGRRRTPDSGQRAKIRYAAAAREEETPRARAQRGRRLSPRAAHRGGPCHP